MKKFYHKKEVSQEETPILLRLERRHTLAEGAQDTEKDRRVSRASSVGSTGDTSETISTPVRQSKTPPNDKSLSDDKRSIFSRASTVVITESELSSSWLYNNQKAQIAATDETAMSSKGQITSNSLETLIPETGQDTRSKSSTITTARSIRQTSCCCYLTIALFIFLVSLGILAAIGGIIYMEVFTAYAEKSNHSISEPVHSQEQLGNGIVNSFTEAEYDEVEGMLDETLQNDRTPPFDGAEIERYERVESNTDSKSEGVHLSEHETNSSDIQNENKSNHVSNENDSASILDGKESTRIYDNHSLEDLPDDSTLSLPKGVAKEISDHDTLDLFLRYNDQVKKHFMNENRIPRRLLVGTNATSENEIQPNNSDFVDQELYDNLENSSYSDIDNMTNNWSDKRVPDSNSVDLLQIPGQLAYLPFDRVTGANKENVPELEFNLPNEDSHHLMNLETDPALPLNINHEGMETLADQVGNDSDSFYLNRNGTVSNNSTEQQVAENPSVAESKVMPFEFFRRLGFDRASMIEHPALTVEDMNVKFSLNEALKYLRSLDTNNKLPASRAKSHIPSTTQINRFPPKMADTRKEQKEYLMKLRRNMLKHL